MARPKKETDAETEKETTDDLVTVRKDGETDLKIHPDALDEHIRLGWVIAE